MADNRESKTYQWLSSARDRWKSGIKGIGENRRAMYTLVRMLAFAMFILALYAGFMFVYSLVK